MTLEDKQVVYIFYPSTIKIETDRSQISESLRPTGPTYRVLAQLVIHSETILKKKGSYNPLNLCHDPLVGLIMKSENGCNVSDTQSLG